MPLSPKGFSANPFEKDRLSGWWRRIYLRWYGNRTARAHGDRSENAEYHAAATSRNFSVSGGGIAGTAAFLRSRFNWKAWEPGYDRLGPSSLSLPISKVEIISCLPESDPDNSVLSYQAPFARAFMGKGVGEKVEIELPMHTGRYEVLEIHPIAAEKIQEILDRIIVKPPEPAGVAQEE